MTSTTNGGSADSPRQGSLALEPLPRLLYRVCRDLPVGSVELSSAAGRALVHVRDGYAVGVDLPGTVDRLGEVLVAAGSLDAGHIALLTSPPPGRKSGELLVSQGVITQAQLHAGLRLQVRRRLHRLFFLDEAEYQLSVREHGRGGEASDPIRVDPLRAIYQGVRSAWSEARFGLGLQLVGGRPVRLVAGTEVLARYGLAQEDHELITQLGQQPRTLAELSALAGRDLPSVQAFVYALLCTDALAIGRGTPSSTRVPRLMDPVAPRPSAGDVPRYSSPSSTSLPRLGSTSATNLPRMTSTSSTDIPRFPPSAIRPATPPGGSPRFPPSASSLPPLSLDGPPRGGSARPVTPSSPAGAPTTPHRAPSSPGVAGPPAAPFASKNISASSGASATTGAADSVARAIAEKVAVVEKQDYFELLGLAQSATVSDIKAAYLQAARTFHPDRLGGLGLLALRPQAEQIFRRMSEAYATLTDDKRREAYLQKRSAPPPAKGDELAAANVVNAEMAFLEGELALKRRDFVVAIDKLTEALRLNPAEGEAVALLAWARFSAGVASLRELRPELERALSLSPRCARAHYYLGMSWKNDDAGRALNAFKQAVTLDERLAEAQSELRLLQSRAHKDSGGGLFDRFRKK